MSTSFARNLLQLLLCTIEWYTLKIQGVLVPLRPALNKPIQIIFVENEIEN